MNKHAYLIMAHNEFYILEKLILLLDDFMSELDEKRRERFLNNIKDIQVIITCTEKLRLEKLKYFSYNVIDGDIIEKA